MKRKLVSAVVVAALLAVNPAVLAQQKISDGVVKIGVLTDMSGTYSDLAGPGSLLAVEMAVKDFVEKEKPRSHLKKTEQLSVHNQQVSLTLVHLHSCVGEDEQRGRTDG